MCASKYTTLFIFKGEKALIEDMMKKVEAAEKEASHLRHEARAKADEIAKASEEKCEQMVADNAAAIKTDLAEKRAAYEEKRNKAAKDARIDAEVKAGEMKQAALEKENEAIDAVIEKII